MKVQQDSKLLFGGNIITRINNIKACQQILQEQQQQKPILKEKLSKNTWIQRENTRTGEQVKTILT